MIKSQLNIKFHFDLQIFGEDLNRTKPEGKEQLVKQLKQWTKRLIRYEHKLEFNTQNETIYDIILNSSDNFQSVPFSSNNTKTAQT